MNLYAILQLQNMLKCNNSTFDQLYSTHVYKVGRSDRMRFSTHLCSHFLTVPCVTSISGNGAGMLVDDTTNHCTAVSQSLDGVSTQYELSVNSTCGNGKDVTVGVMVEQDTDYSDMVSALSVKESDANCSRNRVIVKRCSLITWGVESDKKVCRLRCKCADSAESCLLQIYSRGLVSNPPEIKICEIKIETP